MQPPVDTPTGKVWCDDCKCLVPKELANICAPHIGCARIEEERRASVNPPPPDPPLVAVTHKCGHTQVHPPSNWFDAGDRASGPCDVCRKQIDDEAEVRASGPPDDAEAIQAAFLAAQAKHGFTSAAGLSAPEPPPTPNAHPAVWSLVLKDMIDRDQTGRAKYGTPLQPHNGRRFLVDLYQELLDAAVYVRGRIYEEDGK